MKFFVLVFLFLGLAACNSGGGSSGGNDGCNNPTCVGGYGSGKVVTNPLSSNEKAEFARLFGSHGRAQKAYMRVAYPEDKSSDPIEMQMYEILKTAGCKQEKINSKTGEIYIVDESIANAGCPINFFGHIEASDSKAITSQKYFALSEQYKSLNDVFGITLNEETRISGRNASAEGAGKIISKIHGELSYYIFAAIHSEEDGKNGKIRAGIGIHMPFGLVQAIATTTTVDGKTSTEFEINGEKINTSETPALDFINQIPKSRFQNFKN